MPTAGQSRKASLAEAVTNVLLGYGIAVASQSIIFPLFGIHVSLQESMAIALAFTGVSIVRSYVLRRVFNQLHLRLVFRKEKSAPHNK